MSRIIRLSVHKNFAVYRVRLLTAMVETILEATKDDLGCWDVRHKMMLLHEELKGLYMHTESTRR